MSEIFSAEYWNQRYQQDNTPWDMGTPSPPLMAFCAGLPDKDIRILIPGGGSSSDAGKLWDEGFTQVFVLDWSAESLKDFQVKFPDFPSSHLLHQNFFEHSDTYDLILEQTFYCALPPDKRDDYVRKVHSLLLGGGELVGVLFDFPLSEAGPPFGGSESEYRERFAPFFEIVTLERCRNSIPPRAGKELFVRMVNE